MKTGINSPEIIMQVHTTASDARIVSALICFPFTELTFVARHAHTTISIPAVHTSGVILTIVTTTFIYR